MPDSVKVNPVKPCCRNLAEDVLYNPVDTMQFFGGCVECDADGKDHTPFLHFLEIMNPAFQQVGIGDNQFFTRNAGQPGGFQADVFYGTVQIVDNDCVADFERFVYRDGKRGEQITKDVLDCQRDGDTANTQTGDQCRYVDAEIAEYQKQCDGPDDEFGGEPDNVHVHYLMSRIFP